MIQGNILNTKHILNVITNVLANMLPSKAKPNFCNQNFYLTNAQLKKVYDLNINNTKLPQLLPKENDITSVI